MILKTIREDRLVSGWVKWVNWDSSENRWKSDYDRKSFEFWMFWTLRTSKFRKHSHGAKLLLQPFAANKIHSFRHSIRYYTLNKLRTGTKHWLRQLPKQKASRGIVAPSMAIALYCIVFTFWQHCQSATTPHILKRLLDLPHFFLSSAGVDQDFFLQ